jgi:predicted lipoprotein
MRTLRRRVWLLVSLLAAGAASAVLLTSACDIEPARGPDRQVMLRDLVNNVLVPTYADLAVATDALHAELVALRATPDTATLARAQASYRAARAIQKFSEAMYFGPADDLLVTGGAIDAWPVDAAKLDAVIAGTTPLEVADVAKLGANLRGFPGLEYLLFVDGGVAAEAVLARFQEPSLGTRRTALADSLAADLAARCRKQSDAFAGPTGYGAQIAEAGVSSTELSSQKDGVDKLLTGIVYVSELMVMKKLAAPLGVTSDNVVQPAVEEGPRSDSSIEDLRSNLLAIQALYTGARAGRTGEGFGNALRARDAKVALDFEQALADALAKLDVIPKPLRIALTTSRPQVEAFYQAVRTIKQVLLTQVAGALGSSIGFSFSDTD